MNPTTTETVSAEEYVQILQFYATQMRHLDALDIDAYLQTFTPDGVMHHRHRGEITTGHAAMHAAATAALPRYAGIAARHWNDHYLMQRQADGSVLVDYCTLVTRTTAAGEVTLEPTFHVADELVLDGTAWRTRRRTVDRDRPGDIERAVS